MRSSTNTENTPLLDKVGEGKQEEKKLSIENPLPTVFEKDITRLGNFNQRLFSVRKKYKIKTGMRSSLAYTCFCASLCTCIGGSAVAFSYTGKFQDKTDAKFRRQQKEKIKHYRQQLRNTTYFKQPLKDRDETCQDIIPAKLKRDDTHMPDDCFLHLVTKPRDFYLNCAPSDYSSQCLIPFNGSVENFGFCRNNYMNLTNDHYSYDHINIACLSPTNSAAVGTGIAGGIGSAISLIMLIFFLAIMCTEKIAREGKLNDDLLEIDEEKELGELSKKYSILPKIKTEVTILKLNQQLTTIQKEIRQKEIKIALMLFGCDKEKNPDSHLPELNVIGGGLPLDVLKLILFHADIIYKSPEGENEDEDSDLNNPSFNA